jgi:hypothetical protein
LRIANAYLVIGNVGVVFYDRDLILCVQPSSQVHEFAAVGAEGIGAVGLIARIGINGTLADGAWGVRNFGLGGHRITYLKLPGSGQAMRMI